MTWPPVSSEEAAELREREGVAEDLDDVSRSPGAHKRLCRRGWLGEDSDGRPIVCPVCRPWLSGREEDR